MDALTAAHPTLPLPSYAYVTNMRNGRTILVRINDRGPYAHDRVIDLSRRAARELGTEQAGVAEVRVRYAGRAPLDGNDIHERRFLAAQPWYEAQPGHHAAAPPAPATPVARAWTPAPRVAADATEGGWSATSYRASLAGRR
jgi:rare lipoprotein A